MFIYNVQVSKTKIFKFILCFMAIFCIALSCVGIRKVFLNKDEEKVFGGDCMPSSEVANLTDENYTNVLKEVHENLDIYLGQKICYTGYVYRVADLEDNQFILARDMQIGDTNQTVVVGFLCTLPNAQDYDTYSWVTITGTIEKGFYLGDIPCINISEIEKTKEPENKIVPEPNENFIETAVIY